MRAVLAGKCLAAGGGQATFGSFPGALAGCLRADFLEVFLATLLAAAGLRPLFLAVRFFAVFLAEPFDAMRILSTRLGYGRPARRARAFAADFCADVKCLDFFPARLRGFERFQGAPAVLAMQTQRLKRREFPFFRSAHPGGRGTVERSIASSN